MKYKKIFLPLLLMLTFFGDDAFAYTKTETPAGIGGVASNIIDAIMGVHDLLGVILVAAGSGLILSSIIKYKKYRKNPIEVHLSAVITNLIIGIALIVLSLIPLMD